MRSAARRGVSERFFYAAPGRRRWSGRPLNPASPGRCGDTFLRVRKRRSRRSRRSRPKIAPEDRALRTAPRFGQPDAPVGGTAPIPSLAKVWPWPASGSRNLPCTACEAWRVAPGFWRRDPAARPRQTWGRAEVERKKLNAGFDALDATTYLPFAGRTNPVSPVSPLFRRMRRTPDSLSGSRRGGAENPPGPTRRNACRGRRSGGKNRILSFPALREVYWRDARGAAQACRTRFAKVRQASSRQLPWATCRGVCRKRTNTS